MLAQGKQRPHPPEQVAFAGRENIPVQPQVFDEVVFDVRVEAHQTPFAAPPFDLVPCCFVALDRAGGVPLWFSSRGNPGILLIVSPADAGQG